MLSEDGELMGVKEEGEISDSTDGSKIAKNNNSFRPQTYFNCKYCPSTFVINEGDESEEKDKDKNKAVEHYDKHMTLAHGMCFICEVTIDDSNEFEKHFNNHKNIDGTFSCNIKGCKYLGKSMQKMFNHSGSVHHSIFLYCNGCTMKFLTFHELKVHVNRHMTGTTLQKTKAHVTHAQNMGNIGIRKAKWEMWEHRESIYYNCKHCNFSQIRKGGKYMQAFRTHMKIKHCRCFICEEECKDRHDLEIHINSHQMPDGSLVCNTNGCLARYAALSIIFSHARAVHNNEWAFCDQCSYKCYTVSKLEYHKEKHVRQTQKSDNLENNKGIEIFESESLVVCNECGIQLRKCRMKVHMSRKHSNRPQLSCSKCNFSTMYPSYLRDHEQGHNERYKCENCDFTSLTNSRLKLHVKFKHNGEKSYECLSCDYKTEISVHFKMHQDVHSTNFIKCELCEHKSKSHQRLKIHMQRHQGPKYFCDQCDYKSYDRGNFSTHKTIKHGTDILKCQKCEYETKSKRALRQHAEKCYKTGEVPSTGN